MKQAQKYPDHRGPGSCIHAEEKRTSAPLRGNTSRDQTDERRYRCERAVDCTSPSGCLLSVLVGRLARKVMLGRRLSDAVCSLARIR